MSFLHFNVKIASKIEAWIALKEEDVHWSS